MIRAEESHNDKNALQTVIDGKRPLCYIDIFKQTFTLNGEEYCITSGIDDEYFWDKVKENNLRVIEVKSGPYGKTYICYQEFAHDDAKELLEIAQKHGGSLPVDVEDTRRIGELLGYDPIDIDEFIKINKI
jgi:hypothetical protein